MLLSRPAACLSVGRRISLVQLVNRLQARKGAIITILRSLGRTDQCYSRLIMVTGKRIVTRNAPRRIVAPKLLEAMFDIRTRVRPRPMSNEPVYLVE